MKTGIRFFIFLSVLLITKTASAEWAIDLSRRFNLDPQKTENEKSIYEHVVSVQPKTIAQEFVILQTEQGFIPRKVQVRAGQSYKINVVNINEQQRNVSFVFDQFEEHQATYYGKIKSFIIDPQSEGIFTFQSPETGFDGQLVVLPNANPKIEKEVELRAPASAQE